MNVLDQDNIIAIIVPQFSIQYIIVKELNISINYNAEYSTCIPFGK